MWYRVEQLLMNITLIGLQTYFQTFWFYEHLAEKGIKNKEFYLNVILIIFQNFY